MPRLIFNKSSDDQRAWFDPENGEKLAHFDSRLLPSAGVISATSYATNQVGSNIGGSDSDGYVEIKFLYPEGGTGLDSSPGAAYLFEVNDAGSNNNYFSVYIANHRIFLDTKDSSNIRRIVASETNYTLPYGWNTIRFTSSGSAYTLTANGSAVTLTATAGSNDGSWLADMSAGVDAVSVGAVRRALTTASFAGTSNRALISYVDYNNSNKWIFNDGEAYVYDIIGGTHLAWTGAGVHVERSIGGSTHCLLNGYSLWQKAGSADIQVPYSSSGSALSITPGANIPSGYSKTIDVAGSSESWNKAWADIEFRQVTEASAYVYGLDWGTADLNTNSGTRTWFIRYPHSRIGATGKLRRIQFYYGYSENTSAFKFQVWRRTTGGVYNRIHNVDILSDLPASSGYADVTLSEPLDVVEGDFIALCVTNSSTDNVLKEHNQGAVANSTVYSDAERDDGFDWESATDASANLNVRVFVDCPLVVGVGDSIIAGRPDYGSIIEGELDKFDRSNQILNNIEARDSRFTYLNFGVGGTTLSQILANTQNYALRSNPAFVIVQGGVNDVAGGETDNSAIVDDYEAIVDEVNGQNIPAIALSVLPYTNGTNAQAAQIDALNVLLAAMMKNKSGIFVDLTETMGQFRAGGDAGNLWDLKTEFDADGVHLTPAGAKAAGLKIYDLIMRSYDIDGILRERLDRSDDLYASEFSQGEDSYDPSNPYRFSEADISLRYRNKSKVLKFFDEKDVIKASFIGDNVEVIDVYPNAVKRPKGRSVGIAVKRI